MTGIEVILLTGRTIDQGTSKEHGKLSQEYFDQVAICEMDSEDLKELKIKESSNIRISTSHGSIIVRVMTSKRGSHPKVAYMPYGLWANAVIPSETDGTGMPSFKGIPAIIKPAPSGKIPTIPQLLKKSFRK